MINRKDNPSFLNEFLDYSTTIQNKSLGTIKEYNYDLKHFIQYLVYLYNNSTLPSNTLLSQVKEKKLTISEAIKQISINDLKNAFLIQITLSDIHSFLFHLKSEYNLMPASLGRKVASIRSFFNYICTVGKTLENNPTVGLETPKQPRRLPKHLDLDQSMKLLEVIKTPNSDSEVSKKLVIRNEAIITIFLNCGIRLNELVNIDIKHINFYDNTLSVIGKGNKERSLYLNDACVKTIKEYLKIRPTDLLKDKDALFISERKERISRRTVQHIVKTELSKAGINTDEFSTHKLRHTAATLMFQYGDVDIRSLQKVLGHESVSTTELYTHVNSDQVRSAISRNPLANLKKEEKEKEISDVNSVNDIIQKGNNN